MLRRIAWAGLAVLALGSVSAVARDLGIRGATWPVAEPDLLAAIAMQLTEMQRSGEMDRIGSDARERARLRLEEPEPVPGIAPAAEHRIRVFDPAIVVARDILGPNGEIVALAGTRIDPFEHMSMSADVLFVDGRREAEIAWALSRERSAKIVLLAGRPLDLMRRHGRPFYFDMGGRLAGRFAIRATPTVLSQGPGGSAARAGAHPRDGAHLLLFEIPVWDPSGTGLVPKPESTPQTTKRRETP